MNLLPQALHWRILLGILLGFIFGLIINQWPSELAINYALPIFDLLADIFLRLLKMIVIPLIVTSVFLGVTSVGSSTTLAKIGARTAMYYVLTSLIAIITGLVFVNVLQPGVGANISIGDAAKADVAPPDSIQDLIVRIIPTNPIAALANYDMIGIIFFTILFSIFVLQIKNKRREHLESLVQTIYDTSILIVDFIIQLAPIGVLCLVAKLVATTGVEVFLPFMKYVVTAALALGFHMFVNLPILYYIKIKKNPFTYYKQMIPALLTAFSSASSAGTLPLTMDCALNAGLKQRTVSLVLPLGATVNMDGTALYEGIAVLFIAQVLGVDLSMMQQFTVLITALLVSIGAAGIPHAGLVMMVIVLQAVGLPVEATGMIWAVDRVIDMLRTGVNVWSDSVAAAIIDDSIDESPT